MTSGRALEEVGNRWAHPPQKRVLRDGSERVSERELRCTVQHDLAECAPTRVNAVLQERHLLVGYLRFWKSFQVFISICGRMNLLSLLQGRLVQLVRLSDCWRPEAGLQQILQLSSDKQEADCERR